MSYTDEVLDRADTFKEWISKNGGEFGVLSGYLTEAEDEYDFRKYVVLVPDEHLDLYLRAEAGWKTDVAARETMMSAVGIAVLDPVDVVKKYAPNCIYRYRTGRMCGRAVVPGVDRCTKHGGALIDAEVRRNILMSSYATIVEGSYKAVEALLDVAENGRSEMARVQAAKELLDRAGLVAEVNLNVRISAEIDAGAILRERLNSMATRMVLDVPSEEVIDVGTDEE